MRQQIQPQLTWLAALALLAALAPRATAADPPRLRVAVMTFDSASADPAMTPLGKGLQAMVTTDLQQTGSYDLVERARLDEIQSELKLAGTGAIDPATAARIGKLAGATHLLAGTVTVHGEQMRIDARLFSTEDGRIELTAKIEGEKAAFFELEKDLVKRLVGATGQELKPRARAKLAQIHTADFEAFRKYSEGVAAFDAKDYARSLDALKAAAKVDPEFKLAKLTLEQYEQLIEQVRARADVIETTTREKKKLELVGRAKEDARLAEELWKVAQTTGAAGQLDRLVALYQLAVGYGNISGSKKPFKALRAVDDRFAMQRTADTLCRAYAAEARGLFPVVPVTVTPDFTWDPPFEPGRKTYEEAQADWRRQFLEHRGEAIRNRALLKDILYRPQDFARRLGLDFEAEAKWLEGLHKLAMAKLDPPELWQRQSHDELALTFRRAGLLDAAAAHFGQAAERWDSPAIVKARAQDIERLRDVKKALKKAGNAPYLDEYIRLSMGWNGRPGMELDDAVALFDRKRLDPRGAERLSSARRMPHDEEWLAVDGHMVWFFDAPDLSSGARPDFLRTDELRYYPRRPGPEHAGAFAIVDGGRKAEMKASFELDFRPADDWWPAGQSVHKVTSMEQRQVQEGRPEVVFLFGVADVDVDMVQDPETRRDVIQRPTTGLGVWVRADGVHLVRATETARSHGEKHLELEVLQSKAKDLSGQARLQVSVAVKGKRARVKAGTLSATFKLPEAPDGFYGLHWRGAGYVALSKLRVE